MAILSYAKLHRNEEASQFWAVLAVWSPRSRTGRPRDSMVSIVNQRLQTYICGGFMPPATVKSVLVLGFLVIAAGLGDGASEFDRNACLAENFIIDDTF